MTTTKVSNVEFDTLGTTQKPPPLPSSSHNNTTNQTRPLSSNTTNNNKKRSNSASSARPVLHQPCSSTLGKFHDAVNFSLLNETLSTTSRNASATSGRGSPARQPLASHRSASTSSNTPRSDHPVLVAKQKYKYMIKQKSYVDESLFGGGPNTITNRFG